MTSKRVKWVDIAKGFSILLVILQHISTAYIRRTGNPIIINNNDLFKIIDLVDMPIFFFLSGLFIDHLFKREICKVIFGRFRRLMIPYFIWGIISVIFLSIYEDKILWLRVIELPIKPIFVLWFIYALFLIDIILYLLNKLFRSKVVLYVILLLFIYFITTFWTTKCSIPISSFSRVIQGVGQGTLFVYFGYIYKRYINLNVMKKFICYIILFISLLIIISILSYLNDPFIYLIEQGLSILLVICISKIFTYVKDFELLFTHIGVVTMEMYVMHKFIVEILSFIIVKITANLFMFSIINLVLTTIICYTCILLLKKLHLSKLMFGL